MPKRTSEREHQLGEFWLSHDPKSPDIWCITWFDKKARQTRRRSTGHTDIEEAKLALANWVVMNTTLKDERPDDVPLSVVLDRYWDKHAKNLPSRDSQRAGVARWKEFWADASIADLTLTRQNEFEAWFRRQTFTRGKSGKPQMLSAGTVARQWNVGPTALEWARKAHEIKWYPDVRFLSDNTRRKRILSMQECAALFNAAAVGEEHLWRYLLLAFWSAARPNAPLRICLPMIDLENRRLDLLPPGATQNSKKRRPILPICATLLPWIRLWTQPENLKRTIKRGRNSGKVIDVTHLITYRGRPLQSIRQGFDTLKTRAGIRDPTVVPYSIRHTMTTWFMKQSPRVDEWDREVWLGHKSPGSQTTAGYIHLGPEYLLTAANAIDAFFGELAPLVRKPIRMAAVSRQEKT